MRFCPMQLRPWMEADGCPWLWARAMGLGDAVICDREGAICSVRTDLNEEKKVLLAISNRQDKSGTLAEVIRGPHARRDRMSGSSSPSICCATL